MYIFGWLLSRVKVQSDINQSSIGNRPPICSSMMNIKLTPTTSVWCPSGMRKVTLKSLHELENISKPLVDSTFSFMLVKSCLNVMFDALISKLKMSISKKYSKNKFYRSWISAICSFAQICNVQNVVFLVQMWLPHSWNVMHNNDVTVNTHCDVTMGRWHCLG